MPGLIPLMLASGSRTSYIAPSPTSLRRQSTGGSPGSTSPTTPRYAARPRFPKRLSLPIPVAIPVLPYTKAEWRKTIAEVKRKYFSKRYRACSARCLEVLDGIKDTSQVEPVYLIYLHFYAATSVEICARPLPSTSPLRATLLQQARTHFDRASALINDAEESVLRKFRPGSVGSSRGSSCHSPSGSVSSRAWTPDTSLSSPTDSVCSFDAFSAKSPVSSPKRVKKVSFSLPKDASIHIPAEPIIRPDSPTLGFDDFLLSPATTPLPDLQQSHAPFKFQEIELPLQTIPEHDQETDEQEDENERENTFFLARSVDRCCEHLSSLRTQIARHSTSLDQLLQQQPLLQQQQQSHSRSQSQSQPFNPATATATAKAAAAAAGLSSTGGETTAAASPPPKGEEARALDRAARIERLRRSGWQRKRFDAARYEELCEAVLAELA